MTSITPSSRRSLWPHHAQDSEIAEPPRERTPAPRRVAIDGARPAPAPLLVEQLMSTPVVTFFAEQTLPLAQEVMALHRFRHLPVIDPDGRLVGLVTQRDLLRGQISVLTGLSEAQRRAREEEIEVHQLMTRDVWTVTPDTLAWRAGRTLLDHKFGCLPVVDHDGILCGIVTERDFLKLAMTVLQGDTAGEAALRTHPPLPPYQR